MATYEVTSPDGQTYEVTAPDSASEDDVLAYAKKQFKAGPAVMRTGGLEEAARKRGDLGKAFLRGARDPIDGLTQLYARSLETAANNPFMQRNSMLSPENTKLLTDAFTKDRQKVEDINKTAEQDYRQNWRRGEDVGMDYGRIAGNIAATLPMMSVLPSSVGSIPARFGAGAIQGAASGAAQPIIDTEDFWSDKKKQVGLSALGGGATSAGVGLVSRAIGGSSDPGLRALADAGVRPSLGQSIGGVANTTEQKMTSVPLIGDMIRGTRNKSIEEFNRATANKVLSPIGEKIDDATPIGREAVDEAATKVSQAYDDLLPKLKVKADARFINDVGQLRAMSSNMVAERAEQFDKILKDKVLSKFSPNGSLSGESMKTAESELGRLSAQYRSSADADQRLLGDAIGQLRENLRDLVQRSNPMHKAQLGKINEAYAMLKRLEKAGSNVTGEEGVFSPAQFINAVKALDRTRGKSAFARGDALMQDWAEAGRRLGNTYPDSGTAGRAIAAGLTGAALTGGATVGSPYLAGAGVLGIPYFPLIRDLPGYLAKSPNAYGALTKQMIDVTAPVLSMGAPAAARRRATASLLGEDSEPDHRPNKSQAKR